MDIFTTLSLPRPAHFPHRCVGLLAASLLMDAAVPAWAVTKDLVALPRMNISVQDNNSVVIRTFVSPSLQSMNLEYIPETISAIEAHSDVMASPIRVASTLENPAKTNLANKVAQVSRDGSIAVIYPDIGKPYSSIFTEIIDGIETKTKIHVANFAVGPNVDIGGLNNSLRLQNIRVVIALGWQGVKVASALDKHIGVVAGGVLTATENEIRDMQVNCMSPDPALLFSRLKGMMPKVRRVFTVYDPRQNEWLIRLAKEAARTQELELITYEAEDLRSAMFAYQKILPVTDSSQDALWLLQDTTTVEDSTVLPLILQESWSRNLTVFSSSVSHVRRGVLFSLYPNNVELGHHLADSALGLLASGENKASGMVPLREVLMAVNLRTAKHLGLSINHLPSFDMAFPEP